MTADQQTKLRRLLPEQAHVFRPVSFNNEHCQHCGRQECVPIHGWLYVDPRTPIPRDEQADVREALAAASTALQERGEFHVYADGKVYTRAQCVAMARLLDQLASANHQS